MLHGRSLRRKMEKEALSLDMTPLVDVVFLLLLFFLLTSNLVRPEGFDLTLPKAEAKQVKERGLRIVIPRRGTYMIDDKTYTEGALKNFLSRAVRSNPDLVVHIVSDQDAPAQWLVTGLDIATEAGVKNGLLRTQSKGQ